MSGREFLEQGKAEALSGEAVRREASSSDDGSGPGAEGLLTEEEMAGLAGAGSDCCPHCGAVLNIPRLPTNTGYVPPEEILKAYQEYDQAMGVLRQHMLGECSG